MTVKELIKLLKEEDQKKEVKFCTIDYMDLEFLSIYEEEGVVFIDVGTEEDSTKRNSYGCGK